MALDSTINKIAVAQAPSGIAFSVHSPNGSSGKINSFDLSEIQEITVGKYKIRMSKDVESGARGWVKQSKRTRSARHETGGLLWGLWDDAINVIWLFDISGPPPDSEHEPGHFLCGVEGTLEEHALRTKQSNGTCGFVGLWHTHPNMSSGQSMIDVSSMTTLVSSMGHNQKRVVMLIFGQSNGQPTANIYVYESQSLNKEIELVSVGEEQIKLNKAGT